jgi:WD40 repeat protein
MHEDPEQGGTAMNLGLLLAIIGVFVPAKEPPKSLKEVAAWGNSDRWISAIRFSPDNKTLACSEHGEEWELVLREPRTGRKRTTLGTSIASTCGITFSADSRLVAAVDSDNAIKVWEVATGKVQADFDPSPEDSWDRIAAWGFARDDRALFVAWEKAVKELSLADGSCKTLFTRRVSGRGSAFSADGKTLASSNFQDLDLWDVSSGKIRRVLADHRGSVVAPAFSADGKTVVFGVQRNEGREKKHWEVKVYHAESGKELATIFGGAGTLKSLELNEKASMILARHELPSRPWFDSDAKIELRLYNVATGRERWSRKADDIRGTLSPDGKLLATVEGDNKVKVWELPQPATKKER